MLSGYMNFLAVLCTVLAVHNILNRICERMDLGWPILQILVSDLFSIEGYLKFSAVLQNFFYKLEGTFTLDNFGKF